MLHVVCHNMIKFYTKFSCQEKHAGYITCRVLVSKRASLCLSKKLIVSYVFMFSCYSLIYFGVD